MYLAPLNYDRFFKKVFSQVHIAKAFLEDFLDVKIQEITFLDRAKYLTDASAKIEVDFSCKINGANIIVEMQQWYKPDVIKRFYLYHCASTALQLESTPTAPPLLTGLSPGARTAISPPGPSWSRRMTTTSCSL